MQNPGQNSPSLRNDLQKSEEIYRDIVDHVLEGIIVLQHGKVLYANPMACEISGHDRSTLEQIALFELIHPEDRSALETIHEKRRLGKPTPSHYEVRIIDARNETRWITLGAQYLEWNGTPATLCFFSDITDNKRLQEELKHSLLEREAILQTAQVGISLTANRVHQWVNRAFADLVGYEPAELIGQSTQRHYPNEESWKQLGSQVENALKTADTFTTEWPSVHRNGKLSWVRMSAARVSSQDPSKGIIWSVLDITKHVQAEVEMREALAKQQQLNQMKSRFVSMTSHEFRTPLSTILSSAELLRHYHDRLPAEEQAALFNSIESAVKRMGMMLDNIITLGRADSDRLEFKPTLIDLKPFLDSLAIEIVSTTMDSALRSPNLEITLGDEIGSAWLDESLLRQIVNNLLTNAFKYSPNGGTIRFKATLANHVLQLSVEDQGIGIPPAELPQLFESFHRASNVGNIPGSGLGLSIVKKAAEMHGGNVNVKSTVGCGTRFVVNLPTRVLGPLNG